MGFGTRNVLVLAACMQSRWGLKAWLHLLPAEAFLWSVCTYSLCLPGFIPQTQTSCSMDMWLCGCMFLHLVFFFFFNLPGFFLDSSAWPGPAGRLVGCALRRSSGLPQCWAAVGADGSPPSPEPRGLASSTAGGQGRIVPDPERTAQANW